MSVPPIQMVQKFNAQPVDMPTGYLTPDALMSYCASRLRGLDDQIQSAFLKQRMANAVSGDLSALQQKLNALISGASSLKVVHGGKAENDATIKDLAETLLTAANNAKDPSVAKALADKARALVSVTGDPPNATFDRTQDVNLPEKEYTSADLKSMTSDAVGEIQKDLNSGSELSMINLQSLMSQRQSSVQMVTNMVQALGDQMNKISANIGH
jgi:CII-binding regulator of phage lambda lysogenization HflD